MTETNPTHRSGTTAESPVAASAKSGGLATPISVAAATLAVVFGLLFGVGCLGAWFRSSSDIGSILSLALRFAISGTIGVAAIGATAFAMRNVNSPRWLPSTAAFAAGFAVQGGIRAWLDGHPDRIFGQIGLGFVTGILAGAGFYWAQQNGWVRTAIRSTPQRKD